MTRAPIIASIAVLLLGGGALWWLAAALGVPAPGWQPDPAQLAELDAFDAAQTREAELRRTLAALQQELQEKRAQCRPAQPKPPTTPSSSLAPHVKPSMPATAPRPVEVAPAPALR